MKYILSIIVLIFAYNSSAQLQSGGNINASDIVQEITNLKTNADAIDSGHITIPTISSGDLIDASSMNNMLDQFRAYDKNIPLMGLSDGVDKIEYSIINNRLNLISTSLTNYDPCNALSAFPVEQDVYTSYSSTYPFFINYKTFTQIIEETVCISTGNHEFSFNVIQLDNSQGDDNTDDVFLEVLDFDTNTVLGSGFASSTGTLTIPFTSISNKIKARVTVGAMNVDYRQVQINNYKIIRLSPCGSEINGNCFKTVRAYQGGGILDGGDILPLLPDDNARKRIVSDFTGGVLSDGSYIELTSSFTRPLNPPTYYKYIKSVIFSYGLCKIGISEHQTGGGIVPVYTDDTLTTPLTESQCKDLAEDIFANTVNDANNDGYYIPDN